MRTIALVDMDCFYCQVEEKLNPSLQGKPVAVVQYNLWREGGIIAANYLAKEKGVNKGMWMHEAKELCPNIEFARVAELRGRADLTKYRQAGKQVADVLSTFTNLIERASVDEAYLDLTEAVANELSKGPPNIVLEKLESTHVVNCDLSDFITSIKDNQDTDGFCENDLKLAVGAMIVEKIRAEVYEKTGYRCSAGIAHNKILAKLVCGLHKPNKQTVIPQNAINGYFAELPLKKIKRLGGKFGKNVSETLNIQHVGELLKFTEKELANIFDEKTGHWLYSIARGIDNEPVSPKLLSKSISCCKRFPGKNALFKSKDVEHWLNELAIEVMERLKEDQIENNRKAKTVTLSFVKYANQKDLSNSKTFPLKSYDIQRLSQDCLQVIKKNCEHSDGSYHLKYLGISAGHFENIRKTKNLKYFFEKNGAKTAEGSQMKIGSQAVIPNEGEKCEEYRAVSNINNQEQITANSMENSALENLPKLDEIDSEFNYSHMTENSREWSYSNTQEEKSYRSSTLKTVSGATAKSSFFAKYFDNLNVHNDNMDSHENTDLNIDCPNEGSYNEVPQMESEPQCLEEFIRCDECGQSIKDSDMIQHRDYHYAIDLYKKDLSTVMSSSSSMGVLESNKEISKKRKVNTAEKFYEKPPQLDEAIKWETCSQCSKKIIATELVTHMDYHAAKKLHKEINTQCNNHKSRNNTDVANNSILRFLKKTS